MTTEISFHEKIVTLQLKIKSNKSQFNSFGKYAFRSCEDIIAAFKECNSDNGLSLSLVLSDKVVKIGDRYYVRAKASLSDGKEFVSNFAYAREEVEQKGMAVAQLSGSTSSYARKYALAGLLGLDDEKDDDTRAPKQQQAPSQTNQNFQRPFQDNNQSVMNTTVSSPVTDNQRKAIYAISRSKNIEAPKIDSFEQAKNWITEQNKR